MLGGGAGTRGGIRGNPAVRSTAGAAGGRGGGFGPQGPVGPAWVQTPGDSHLSSTCWAAHLASLIQTLLTSMHWAPTCHCWRCYLGTMRSHPTGPLPRMQLLCRFTRAHTPTPLLLGKVNPTASTWCHFVLRSFLSGNKGLICKSTKKKRHPQILSTSTHYPHHHPRPISPARRRTCKNQWGKCPETANLATICSYNPPFRHGRVTLKTQGYRKSKRPNK